MKPGRRFSLVAAAVLAACLPLPLAPTPACAAELQINPVTADKAFFLPAKGEQVTVRFRLSAPARASLLIYDAREILVRRVAAKGELPAGEHALAWDGREDRGKLLPPEAYHYAVRATAGAERVEFDLTDRTGTPAVIARDVAWDPNKKVIRYLLPEASRVNVRVGLQNGGPLLRTLLNWLPREAGVQEEPWDGMDESGVIDLSAHPRMSILVHAVGLPKNTIVIGPRASERTAYVEIAKPERRTPKGPPRAKRRTFAAQTVEQMRDLAIALTLPKDLRRGRDGVPIVSGPIPVQMDIPDKAERARLLAERVETAFFVDGAYRFENEAAGLPISWTFDPTGMNPGEHYITGNLLGYEGHFGTATVRVRVAPASD